jgi:FlaA1/EpsC-like NDP-sugar epimerase
MLNRIYQLSRKGKTPRLIFFLVSDIIAIGIAVWLSFILRFDGEVPSFYAPFIKRVIILAVVFLIPIFYFQRLYSFSWSYVSTSELVSLFKAVSLGFLFLAVALYLSKDFPFFKGFPRSTLAVSYFLVFILCGGVRFSKRIYRQFAKKKMGQKKEKTLIVGAGDAGEQLLRSILNSENPYSPVGFIDDNPAKQGVIIHGLKVLGKIKDIPKIVKKQEVEELIIALPSVGSEAIKNAVEMGRKAGLKKIKIIPPISEIIDGVSIRSIRDIQVDDLLGRRPVLLDMKSIENFIQNKTVLITGAAGSIGSELSRQVAKFRPSLLLLLDQDETGIFNITEELKERFSGLKFNNLIADIQNGEKINRIFAEYKPDIVFHAAAYKHVPLMEEHPEEAVKNNILGLKNIAEASLKSGAEKFIFISTDKAVNPTSIMGATKRIGEMVCQVSNQKNHTRFISVRFGNVLDSRGSVVPVFREQIKRGGPIKITHPEMKRYFMVTSEAVLLVMQAGALGEGGEVFVLNMGEPVKILDLAKEMIRLSGLEPDKDIPIVFTQPRPGEKFFEEILTAEEGTVATQNQNIFRAKLSAIDERKLEEGLAKLKEAAVRNNRKEIIDILKSLISFYQPR